MWRIVILLLLPLSGCKSPTYVPRGGELIHKMSAYRTDRGIAVVSDSSGECLIFEFNLNRVTRTNTETED